MNFSNRMEVIQYYIDKLEAKTYLEIGVRHGASFIPIRCEKKIGVDPKFVNADLWGGDATLFETTSDEYFKHHAEPFDVAFIDGLHTHKQSLMDVYHCLQWIKPDGVILLHDCNPKKKSITVPGGNKDYSGEVWKTIVALRTNPMLNVFVLDCDYGIGVVREGKADSCLKYSYLEIEAMTYKDLKENRKRFLNLKRSI